MKFLCTEDTWAPLTAALHQHPNVAHHAHVKTSIQEKVKQFNKARKSGLNCYD